MGEESMNFVRISRLISVDGAKVLRHLLEETAQTLFLNDLENVWLEQVQRINNTSYAAKLWGSFMTDISRADKTLRESFKPLLMSWKFPTNQVLTCTDEKPMLKKWKRAIEEHVRSGSSSLETFRLSWIREIEKTLATINIISESLKRWTTELRKLCQTSRQDLLKILKQHYDGFVTSSIAELNDWNSMSKSVLVRAINDVEMKRKKMKEDWKEQSETYFRNVGTYFKNVLESWKENSKQHNIPELKQLFDAFETEIIAIDDNKLQKSCGLWHDELSDLFQRWLDEIDKRKRSRLLKISVQKELRLFNCIGSWHVRELFASVPFKETLTKQLSKKQLSKLVSSSGIPNLNAYGTTNLFIFFRNYLLYPPMQGWHEDPEESDLSLSADILRLLFFGKDIIKHTEKCKMDHHTFDKLWSGITEVLLRLASQSGDDFEKVVRSKVQESKQLSLNKKSELLRILEFCELAELYGKVEPPIHKTLKRLNKRVKRVKSGLNQESSQSSSDGESSHSSSDEESSSGKSDSESSQSSSDEESNRGSGSRDRSRH